MPHFESEFRSLADRLLPMGIRVEEAVRNAIQALVQCDDDLARSVVEKDIEIDQLAKAPLVAQLRLLLSTAKITQDLKRVGEKASAIARRCLELSQEPLLTPYADVLPLAKLALEILNDALGALLACNFAKSRGLILQDSEVDLLSQQLNQELASCMIEKPIAIGRCLNLMGISKALERIADHAKSVAENVVHLSAVEENPLTEGSAE